MTHTAEGRREATRIWVLDLARGAFSPVPGEGFSSPVWTADGTRLVAGRPVDRLHVQRLRRNEVYVQPFPGPEGGRHQVSLGGGQSPLWSRDGRELFFMTVAELQVVLNGLRLLSPGGEPAR